YLVCLTFLYPWLYRIEQTSFAYALILMAFVKVMAESYISFGSEAAFDSYFNVAQFLKIVAYLVPFMALMLDYVRLHKKEIKQRIKIAEQKVALEDSNRELDEFAYIVSHDLKEPLRGIQSYAQFVQEDYDEKLDDEGRKMLGSLVRLGDRMQNLIGDLLTYSRVGRVELATQKCNLNNVVDSVLELLSARLASDNIKVKFEHDLPVITCDKTRIHEVFMNFVSNSIKYNDKAERWVEIGCETKKVKNKIGETKEVLAFYVGDNGIGIPERHQEKVFGIFKRLHGKDKFGGGTGSGLTITKKIIERHNGQVWISSVEGEGTRFYFTIGKIEGS
ncbi:ATP-binding protein, partial [Francisellaceae bacterium]|nr:ATP-binding protein [Francisellaceae bacterium]